MSISVHTQTRLAAQYEDKGWIKAVKGDINTYPDLNGDYYTVRWDYRDKEARRRYGHNLFVSVQHYNSGYTKFLGDETENRALFWRPLHDLPDIDIDQLEKDT